MPLPQLELIPSSAPQIWSGVKVIKDIRFLLKDVHEGVLDLAEELEIGSPPFNQGRHPYISVLAFDEPQADPPSFGYVLHIEDPQRVERTWKFIISTEDYHRTSGRLLPALVEPLTTTSGRVHLSILLQAGLSPEIIARRLVDPTILFVRAKIANLEREAAKALAESQEEERKRGIDRLINTLERRKGLRVHPLAQHFMLGVQISTLTDMVIDLEKGVHLA